MSYHHPRHSARSRRASRHIKWQQGLFISSALPLQPYRAPHPGTAAPGGPYGSYSRYSTRRSRVRPPLPVQDPTPSLSRYPTVAQSIVAQYRHRTTAELDEARRRERYASSSMRRRPAPVLAQESVPFPVMRSAQAGLTSSVEGSDTLYSSEHAGPSLVAWAEPRARLTHSCALALDNATQEAYMMMLRSGAFPTNIFCTRPGCAKVLPDLRALATHIHIHNLDSMDYARPGTTRGVASRRAAHSRPGQYQSTRRRHPVRSRWRKTLLKMVSRILPSLSRQRLPSTF